MPVDEFLLRDLANELAEHYTQLDSMKHDRPTPPEVKTRNAIKGLGPQSPGNWLFVSTFIDQEQRLREVAFNAFSDLGIIVRDGEAGAIALCRKIAFHAQAISELDWADDLADELARQARIINRRCNPAEKVPGRYIEQAQSSDQLLTASHAAKVASAATGEKIDRKQITYWGQAGYIKAYIDSRGKACYKLAEIVAYVGNQHG